MPPFLKGPRIPRAAALEDVNLVEALLRLTRQLGDTGVEPPPLERIRPQVSPKSLLEDVIPLDDGRYQAAYRAPSGEVETVDFPSTLPIEREPLRTAKDRRTQIGNVLGMLEDDTTTRELTREDRIRQAALDVRDSRTALAPFDEEYGGAAAQQRKAFRREGAAQWQRVGPGNSVEKQRRKGGGADLFGEVEEKDFPLIEPKAAKGPSGLPLADQSTTRANAIKWAVAQPDAVVSGATVTFKLPDGRQGRITARTPHEAAFLEARGATTPPPVRDWNLAKHLDELESQSRKLLRGEEALNVPGVAADELAALDEGTLTAFRTSQTAPQVRFWHPSGETRDITLGAEGVPLPEADAARRMGLSKRAATLERAAAMTPGGTIPTVRPLAGTPAVPRLPEPRTLSPKERAASAANVPPLPAPAAGNRQLITAEHWGEASPEGHFISGSRENPQEGYFIEGFGRAFSDAADGFELSGYRGDMGDVASPKGRISRGAPSRATANRQALKAADVVAVLGVKRGSDGRVFLPKKDDPTYWLAQAARTAERLGKTVHYGENAEQLAATLLETPPGGRVYLMGAFPSEEMAAGFATRVRNMTRIPGGSDAERATALRKLGVTARSLRQTSPDNAAMKAVHRRVAEAPEETTLQAPFALADGSVAFGTDPEGRTLAVQGRALPRKGSRGATSVGWTLPSVSTREIADAPGEGLPPGVRLPKRFQRVPPQEIADGWTLIGVDPSTGLGATITPRPEGGWRLKTNWELGGDKYPDLALPRLHGHDLVRGQKVTLPSGEEGTVVNPVAQQIVPGLPIRAKEVGPDGLPRTFAGAPDRVDIAEAPVVAKQWDPKVHSSENTFFIGTKDEAAALGVPGGIHVVPDVEAAKALALQLNRQQLRGAALSGQYTVGEAATPKRGPLRPGPAEVAEGTPRQRGLFPAAAGEAPSRTPTDLYGFHVVAGPSTFDEAASTFSGVTQLHRPPIQPSDAAYPGMVAVNVPSSRRVNPLLAGRQRLQKQLATASGQEAASLERQLVALDNAIKGERAEMGNEGSLVGRTGRRTTGMDPGETRLLRRGDLTPGERPQLTGAPFDRTPEVESAGRVGNPAAGADADSASEALLVRQLSEQLGIPPAAARQRLDAERPFLGRQMRMSKEDGLPTAQGPRDFGAVSDVEGLKGWITQMAAEGALGSKRAEEILSRLLAFARGDLHIPGEESLLNSFEGPPFDVPYDEILEAVSRGRAWAASPEGQQWHAQKMAELRGSNVSMRDASAVEATPDDVTRQGVLDFFAKAGLSGAGLLLTQQLLMPEEASAAPVPSSAKVALVQAAEASKAHPLGAVNRFLQIFNSVYQPVEATMNQRQVEEFRRRMGAGMGNADAGLRPIINARAEWDSATGAPELLTEALNLLRRKQVFTLAAAQEEDLKRQIRMLQDDAPEGQLNNLLSRLNDIQRRTESGDISPWGATESELMASAEAELLAKDGGQQAIIYAQEVLQPKVQAAIAPALQELYGPQRAGEMLSQFWLPLDKQLAWDVEGGGPRAALAAAAPNLPPENLDMPSATSVHGFKGSIDELADPWKAIERRVHRIWTEYSSNEASQYVTAHLAALDVAKPVPMGERPPDLGPGWEVVSNVVQGEKQQFVVPQIYAEVLREDRRGVLALLQHFNDAIGASVFGKAKGVLSTAMTGASLPFTVGQIAIDVPAALLQPRYKGGVAPIDYLRDYFRLFAEEFSYAWNHAKPYTPEAEEARRSGALLGGWSRLYQNTGSEGAAPDNPIVNTLLKPVADLLTSPHEHAMKRAAYEQLRRTQPEMPTRMLAGDVRANAGTPDLAAKSGLTQVTGVETLTNFVNAQTRVVEQAVRALFDPESTAVRVKQAAAALLTSMVALPLWNRSQMGNEEYARLEQQPGVLPVAVPFTMETLSDGRQRPMVARFNMPKMLELVTTAFEEPLRAAFGAESWTQALLNMAESVLPGQADLKDTAIGASLADRAVSTLQPLARYPAEVYGTGRRSLTGAPIESDLVMRRLPADRYNVSTGATAKGLGRMSGTSPIRLQHAIDTLLPGTLGAPIHGLDKMLAPDGTFGASTQERLYSSNPITRRFLVSPFNAESERVRDAFGALYQQMEQAKVSSGLPNPANPEEIRWLLRFKPQFDALQARMAREIRREREVIDTPGVSEEVRRRREASTGARQREILDAMQRAIARYEAARQRGGR